MTGDDDAEGYEPRPDWAKAIHQDKPPPLDGDDLSDLEDLSDLQEEALCIPRSALTDLVEIGEGMCRGGGGEGGVWVGEVGG